MKYPKELNELGDHLKTRRLDLGLTQPELAQRLGVDTTTIHNWETNATSPQIHYNQAIIRFLGYNPFPLSNSTAGKLISARKALGLTQKKLAKRLRIDPTTLARWEKGRGHPSKQAIALAIASDRNIERLARSRAHSQSIHLADLKN